MFLLVVTLALLSPSEASVDCRLACRRCRESREHAALLEVHCAMCQECKLRRREMIYGPKLPPQSREASVVPMFQRAIFKRNDFGATTGYPSAVREGRHEEEDNEFLEQYPEGCPTPPPCQSESEEKVTMKHTTEKTCPPVVTCKRKHTTTTTTTTTKAPPCIPCMPMCMSPCLQNPPVYYPPPTPAPPPYNPPAVCNPPATCNQPATSHPPANCNQPDTCHPNASTAAPSGTPTTSDYYYVYLGVPKHLLESG